MELTSAVHRAIDGVRANARPWVLDAIREEACVFGPVAVWRHYSRYFAELIKTHLASARHAPPAIVLIGVPGSGKSTFSSMLLKASPLWRHVSQDLLGTKKACRAVMQEATQAGLGVIVCVFTAYFCTSSLCSTFYASQTQPTPSFASSEALCQRPVQCGD